MLQLVCLSQDGKSVLVGGATMPELVLKITSQLRAPLSPYKQPGPVLTHIMESVDSICSSSVDTQYMIIQKNLSKTVNL